MSENSVRILITGLNGFIGKNLVQGLNAEGLEIVGVSVEDSCFLSGVKSYEQADISDFERMKAIFDKYRPDCVIHLAAIVHKKSLAADYDTFYKINYLSSENIFRLCQKYDVKKLLFSSTVEVYDMKAGEVLNEASATLPLSDYGKTKLLAEQALIGLAENSKLNYAIIRFAPVYGADFTLNLDRRIYLVRKKLLYYFGSGNYFYNMCSIFNVVDFVKAFIGANHPSGVYNISDTKNYSVKELVTLEKVTLKKKSKAPASIRLPYHLTYIAIAMMEGILKIIKRRSVFTVYNFKKIFKGIVFDNMKAAGVVGGFRWDVMSTLYGGGMGHQESI